MLPLLQENEHQLSANEGSFTLSLLSKSIWR